MAKGIRFYEAGGPEVMQWESIEVGSPGPGEVRVRHLAVGLNFADTYFRSGLYPAALPAGMGVEGAGVVEAVGAGVTDFVEGDRVTYTGSPLGAYSTERVMSADHLIKLPDTISFDTAAAMTMRGLTSAYLLRRIARLEAGDTVLLHAAAGGVGLIVSQWARELGIDVIGSVSTDEKAEVARANGCTHTIVYTRENFVDRVKEITGGKGVPVVYDGVGKDTFPASLDCLSPRGMFVSFGNASGSVPPFNLMLLAQKGSLFATRPTLVNFATDRASLTAMANELFEMVQAGKIKIDMGQTFALKDAAEAHRALQSRQTTGSTLLLP